MSAKLERITANKDVLPVIQAVRGGKKRCLCADRTGIYRAVW